MKPSEELSNYSRPVLLDDELAWIGAVVSYWAGAEHFLDMLIGTLRSIDKNAVRAVQEDDVRGRAAKVKYAKEIAPIVLSGFPLHLEITLALLKRCHRLADDRNKFAHWLAIRSEEGIQFVDPRELDLVADSNTVKDRPVFTLKAMSNLCKSMLDWIHDVTLLPRAYCIDGPLAARMSWPEGKPDMTLDWSVLKSVSRH